MNKSNLATRILRALGLTTYSAYLDKSNQCIDYILERNRASNECTRLCTVNATLRSQVDTQVDTIKYLTRELDNAERELFGMALRSPSNGGIQ